MLEPMVVWGDAMSGQRVEVRIAVQGVNTTRALPSWALPLLQYGSGPRTDRTLWGFLFGYIIVQSVGSVRYVSNPNG